MSIQNAYQKAYERIEQEKTAEYLVDSYGTEDGFLPVSYANAFIQLEKEAQVQDIVDTFAPETQYIPAKYVEPLQKEAFGFIKELGKGMIRSGHGRAMQTGKMVKATKDSAGNIVKGSGGLKMNKNLTAGQQISHGLGRAQKRVGQFMVNNPNATAAIGAGGVGLGGYAALGGGGGK